MRRGAAHAPQLLLLLAAPLAAIQRPARTIELVTDEGDVVMDSATASCAACRLILGHLQNQTRQEFVKVPTGGGALSQEKRSARAATINQRLFLHQVLDGNRCREDMEQYYLGFVHGEVQLIRKTPAGDMPYPGHPELMDWAKQELALFCFAFLEANEEILEKLITDKVDLAQRRVCEETLPYCKPLPPPPQQQEEPPPENHDADAWVLQAQHIFRGFDSDSDGKLTRDEVTQAQTDHPSEREERESFKKSEEGKQQEQDAFFAIADADKDGVVELSEYLALWDPAKKQRDAKQTRAAESGATKAPASKRAQRDDERSARFDQPAGPGAAREPEPPLSYRLQHRMQAGLSNLSNDVRLVLPFPESWPHAAVLLMTLGLMCIVGAAVQRVLM